MSRAARTTVLDARAMSRALQRMAVEILELAHGPDGLALIGIQRRGVELAERLAKLIERDAGGTGSPGALDITPDSGELAAGGPKPLTRPRPLPGGPPGPPPR